MITFFRTLHQSLLTLMIVFTLALAIGCGSTTKSDTTAPAAPAAKSAAVATAPQAASPGSKPAADVRKVIETAQVTLETRDLAVTENKVLDLLAKRQGKMDVSNVSLDGNGRKTGNYTLRIPAGTLQGFVLEITAFPDIVVRQRTVSSQDVTEEFVDLSARLENMQRQEIRLREILAKANNVDEILKVEKELAAVRGQIESSTGRLKAMTGRIDMSTLQLRISEVTVITETNFEGKLRGILRDSWVAAGDVFLYLIATVIILSPIVLCIAAIVWFWRLRSRKMNARGNQATHSDEPLPK